MERGSQKNGSILVMVLIISAFIMVVATVSLRSGTLLYELALDRVEQTEHFKVAQALIYYGIAHCKTLGEDKRKAHQLSFDQWPFDSTHNRPPPDEAYAGKIAIEPRKLGYMIEATLYQQEEELCCMQAEIEQEKGVWRIVYWQIG